jgi:hypothetical protein
VVTVLNTTTLKVTKKISVGARATDIVTADTTAGEYAYVTG